MARKRRDYLSRAAEEYAMALIFEATGGKVGKERPMPEGTVPKEQNVAFSDRRALLDSIVKLIEKRHKMSPDEPDEPDGINSFKDMLNGPGGESRDRGASTEAALSDADQPSDDD